MNKFFLALLVLLFCGCGDKSSSRMRGHYHAKVFVDGQLVDNYNCHRYTRTNNNYKLWTDTGIVEISGNVIIEEVRNSDVRE